MHNPNPDGRICRSDAAAESWPTSVCAVVAVIAAAGAWALVLVFGWTLWSAFAG
jgi:hypothetical protein